MTYPQWSEKQRQSPEVPLERSLQGASFPQHGTAYLPAGLPEQAVGIPEPAWCQACLSRTVPSALGTWDAFANTEQSMLGPAAKSEYTDRGEPPKTLALSLSSIVHACPTQVDTRTSS